MKNLPLLKILKDSNLIKNHFPELLMDDIDEALESMRLNYNHALLSNFEMILSKDDERIKLLSDRYYMSLQECKFINFIEEVFLDNDKKCIIKTDFFNMNYDTFLSYLNSGIDIKFQYILLHQYINFHNIKSEYFMIKDVELLKLFITFILKEQWISHFFIFPKNEICLISNCDQLFPIFFKNKFIIEKYSKIAKKCGVYLI
ncbi:hypothetical protein [Campylobacter sputorum]|uniref:hypothetical protein n=1 Tax=Campylobacter sputorum TaxID=206 RepID=UPI001E571CCC|nr:hypothetical protein [Campylobacter sputorum]